MAKKFVSKENLQSAWSQKIKPAIDAKITNPSGGSNGDFLKKTANGEEWAEVEIPEVVIDKALNDSSTNPVENKAVKAAIDAVVASLEDYATTSEMESAIAAAKSEIIGGAGEDYDTLKEIEEWVEEHQDLYEALVNGLSTKATTDYVDGELAKKADKTELEAVKTDLTNNYYTSSQVDGLLGTLESAIGSIEAYTEEEILAIFS